MKEAPHINFSQKKVESLQIFPNHVRCLCARFWNWPYLECTLLHRQTFREILFACRWELIAFFLRLFFVHGCHGILSENQKSIIFFFMLIRGGLLWSQQRELHSTLNEFDRGVRHNIQSGGQQAGNNVWFTSGPRIFILLSNQHLTLNLWSKEQMQLPHIAF